MFGVFGGNFFEFNGGSGVVFDSFVEDDADLVLGFGNLGGGRMVGDEVLIL